MTNKSLEELDEEWAVEAEERLERLQTEVKNLRSSKSEVQRKLETLIQKLFDIHTDMTKSCGVKEAFFQLNVLETMEMVIFNLEKIKRQS